MTFRERIADAWARSATPVLADKPSTEPAREERSITAADFGLAAPNTTAGVTVNGDSGLSHSDAFSCIRLLAFQAATIPVHVYRKTADGRENASDIPAAQLLRNPAPGMTQSDLITTAMVDLLGWGNAYLAKFRDQEGLVAQFGFIHPSRVSVSRQAGEPIYVVTESTDGLGGSRKTYTRRDILHLKGLSQDGLVGVSPITMAREAFGIGMQLQDYAARFFSSGTSPGGTLNLPEGKQLSKEAADRLRASWESMHSGTRNAHRVAVLEDGVTYQGVSMSMADAQFLEQRRLSATEVARIIGVPAYMIDADSGSSMTYGNVEQQALNFTMFHLRPWLVKIEQALKIDADLFPSSGAFYPEFTIAALLRADTTARNQAYSLAHGKWMTTNEIRERENLPPVPGGDDLAQTEPVTPPPVATEPPPGTDDEESDDE